MVRSFLKNRDSNQSNEPVSDWNAQELESIGTNLDTQLKALLSNENFQNFLRVGYQYQLGSPENPQNSLDVGLKTYENYYDFLFLQVAQDKHLTAQDVLPFEELVDQVVPYVLPTTLLRFQLKQAISDPEKFDEIDSHFDQVIDNPPKDDKKNPFNYSLMTLYMYFKSLTLKIEKQRDYSLTPEEIDLAVNIGEEMQKHSVLDSVNKSQEKDLSNIEERLRAWIKTTLGEEYYQELIHIRDSFVSPTSVVECSIGACGAFYVLLILKNAESQDPECSREEGDLLQKLTQEVINQRGAQARETFYEGLKQILPT